MKKTLLIDDLDRTSEGATTRRLVIGERTWLVDLTDENFAKLEKANERFTKVARETTPARDNGADPYAGLDIAAVRSWATDNGLEVEPRGRIAIDVVNAYKRAMAEADDEAAGVTEPNQGELAVA